jgi:hypothetical protein
MKPMPRQRSAKPELRTVTWAIRWSNPHKPRRPDQPEELLRVTRRVASTADTPPEITAAYKIGTGYCIQCSVTPGKPPRRLSEASKRKMRRTKLRKRLEKNSPLFADELYEETIRENPNYY